jgi:type VI secretion system protein ImpG
MEDLLLTYYERELTFIREMGAEFARKYPKIAGRLLLEPDKCNDPHTERLIEAFAFIAGRIHRKIDDDFPEITEALLNIVYPHYIRPIPSLSIVKFEPIAQNIPETGYLVKKRTNLFSKPVKGVPCQFVTSQAVRIWPVEVVSASLQDPKRPLKNAQQCIHIRLKTFNGIKLSELNWERLRFYLNGQSQHVFPFYELLFNNVIHVEMEAATEKGKTTRITLSPQDIQQVGLEPEERVLPFPQRSFPGYLLLIEYFSFPEKFLFFDLLGMSRLRNQTLGEELDIWIYLDRAPRSQLVVDQDTFCLNAVPAANLFHRIAEPIRVEQRKVDYQVIPDIRRQEATEVFSVDQVKSSPLDNQDESVEFKPFYSIRHHLEETLDRRHNAFWHLTRRFSGRKGDHGTEIFLSFTDLDLKPSDPGVEVLTVHVTCTNRDLPGRLPFGDPEGDFDLEAAAPVARINSLVKPTPTRRPFLRGALQWRLISHLSLNYLSLVEGGEEALREILKLYDYEDSPATRQQIAGIVGLGSEHVTKRIGQSFGRGVQTTVTLDRKSVV